MRASWDRRIRRAGQLAADNGAAAPLLAFYARLLRSQKNIYDSLSVRPPSGDLDGDIALLTDGRAALLREVAESGPDLLAAEARALLESDDSTIASLLAAYWRAPSSRQFFPKAMLQPYAQWLADAGVTPAGRTGPPPATAARSAAACRSCRSSNRSARRHPPTAAAVVCSAPSV